MGMNVLAFVKLNRAKNRPVHWKAYALTMVKMRPRTTRKMKARRRKTW